MKAIRKSISLTEIEDNIVENLSKVTGINNYSVALRLIIREWAKQNAGPLQNIPVDPLHTTPE